MDYKELVQNHERISSSLLTVAQHKELIVILEKRLPLGSRIQSDYRAAKCKSNNPNETWVEAITRLHECPERARALISVSKSYGPTDVVYSFPLSAIPPTLQHLKGLPGAPVPLAKRETITDKPQVKVPLRYRSEITELEVVTPKPCRSCGTSKHLLVDCPVLYVTDANSDHQIDWADSTLGKAWLVQGYDEYEEQLVLPGYEDRKRHLPKGSKPYLMTSTNKRSKPNINNQFSEGTAPNNNNNDNNHNNNNNNNMGGPRRFQNPNQYNNNNQNRRFQGQQYPPNNYGQQFQGNQRYNANQGQFDPNQGGNFCDNDHGLLAPDNLYISSVSIPHEFLHDPSTSPSQHLNMTVFVQDKDKSTPNHKCRAVAKGVLDTANYAADFISFSMIRKLDAVNACYDAPKAITVCSGLDGHCYLNDKVIDVGIQFHSYDNICNTIYLTLRVNSRSSIEILLGRNTINNHNFMSLTPFAFGITVKVFSIT